MSMKWRSRVDLVRGMNTSVSFTASFMASVRGLTRSHRAVHTSASQKNIIRRIVVKDDFSTHAEKLREHFDDVMQDPLTPINPSTCPQQRFAWDMWHVPGQYSSLRTLAREYFTSDGSQSDNNIESVYEKFEKELITFGKQELGCQSISVTWMSNYLDRHYQHFHVDAPHGPFAWVLSLCPQGKNNHLPSFSGGKTTLLTDSVLDYWRHFDPEQGKLMRDLVDEIEPAFNRFIVFDGRIPHAVSEVSGVSDPRYGRLVLHGWFTDPSPSFHGVLEEEDVIPTLDEALDAVYDAFEERLVDLQCTGLITLRLIIDTSGSIQNHEWLVDTLIITYSNISVENDGDAVAEEEVIRDFVKSIAVENLITMKFPESDGTTVLTLPFVFQ